jgi:hypothetical protein
MKFKTSLSSVGQKFGQLTVTSVLIGKPDKRGRCPITAICKCDCGKTHTSLLCHIRSGKTVSCGCYKAMNSSKRFTKHGLSKSKEYRAWQSMKDRCHNPRNPRFRDYGGRGIRVCEKWRNDFSSFYKDVGHMPSAGYEADRKNNEGDYDPRNFRWATLKEQARNKRTSHNITYKNQTRTLAEWSEMMGISRSVLHYRLKKGWSVERVLTKKVH